METREMAQTPLAVLAEHCLAARDLIDAVGDPVMRAALDLLLAEVGRALAQSAPAQTIQEG